MITADLFKRSMQLAFGVLLVVVVSVACIEVLTLATGAPAVEGWMLSTGPLP